MREHGEGPQCRFPYDHLGLFWALLVRQVSAMARDGFAYSVSRFVLGSLPRYVELPDMLAAAAVRRSNVVEMLTFGLVAGSQLGLLGNAIAACDSIRACHALARASCNAR